MMRLKSQRFNRSRFSTSEKTNSLVWAPEPGRDGQFVAHQRTRSIRAAARKALLFS